MNQTHTTPGFYAGDYRNGTVLYNRDGHPIQLGGMYRGSSAFLVCSGPSLKEQDLGLLNRRGILTMGLNNSPALFRPHLWIGADLPQNFIPQIWQDAAVTKFIPAHFFSAKLRTRNQAGRLIASDQTPAHMPQCYGYKRNARFFPETFLTEPTFNWGCGDGIPDPAGVLGSTSVMYTALKMLFYLGVRTVYLLGCDFQMPARGDHYAFDQHRSASWVDQNNRMYRVLNTRLAMLKPHFQQAGFHIFNCTPRSRLTVFPKLDFEKAIQLATSDIPQDIHTQGMYEPQSA